MQKKLLSLSSAIYLLSPWAVSAQLDPKGNACSGANLGQNGECTDAGLVSQFDKIINGLLFLIGILAVVMIIIGAIRYVTSAGNEDAAKSARGTIIAAVAGLAVAILAYAILNYVVGVL